MNIFDKWDEWVNSTEGSVVNFLTAFAPWLAPLAPAYMTYRHMNEFLLFPLYISLPLALLVEILGFGTVSTGLDFWFYNRRERANSKKAPIEVVIGVFVFYLFLILVSNVVIDISVAYFTIGWQKAAIIIVRALLTLQTIPGALIVAVRTGHRELLRDIKRDKSEKDDGKFQESSRKVLEVDRKPVESSKKLPDWRKMRPTLSRQDLEKLSNLTPDMMRTYSSETDFTYKTISNWRNKAREELGLEKDENK